MLTPSPNGARWPEPQPLANPGRFSGEDPVVVEEHDGLVAGVDVDLAEGEVHRPRLRSGAEPVGPAGVSQADLEAVFVRGRVAELCEPARGA